MTNDSSLKTIEVVPAIIPHDLQEIERDVVRVKDYIRRVQVDVMDGKYVSTKTWPFNSDSDEQFTLPYSDEVEYEIDMLAEEPEKYVDMWVDAGAKAFIFHARTITHLDIWQNVQVFGVEVGLAFVPSQSADEMSRYIETYTPDFVQVMGNDKLGYHGVDLDPVVYERLRVLRAAFPGLSIAVDIGVDGESAPRLVEAGANKLVSGSYIFESDNVDEAIRKLKRLS